MSASSLLLFLFAALSFLSCETRSVYRPIRAAEWNEPLAYLEALTKGFSTRLYQYGLRNLTVEDFNRKVNDTRYNINLVGDVDYTHGIVVDCVNITVYHRDYMWYFNNDNTQAVVTFKIALTNLSMTYDLKAVLEVADVTGRAQLIFPENLIAVNVVYDMSTLSQYLDFMRTNGVKGPLTDYTPDSDVMRAIAYNARLSLSTSLYEQMDTWIKEVFQGMMQQVVQDTPFPLKLTSDSITIL